MGLKRQKVTVERDLIREAFCDLCGAEIEFDFKSDTMDYSNPTDASQITQIGWYGGFIDPVPGEPGPDFLACYECSESFQAWYRFRMWLNNDPGRDVS